MPKDAFPASESNARFFYVRYESFPPLTSNVAESYINVQGDPRTATPLDVIGALGGAQATYPPGDRGDRGDPVGVRLPTRSVDASYGQPDIISKVVTLLKGKNFIVHSAAELAEAIRKIEGYR